MKSSSTPFSPQLHLDDLSVGLISSVPVGVAFQLCDCRLGTEPSLY